MKQWEKEFDEKFDVLVKGNPDDGGICTYASLPHSDEIKAFISDLLKRERAKALDEYYFQGVADGSAREQLKKRLDKTSLKSLFKN